MTVVDSSWAIMASFNAIAEREGLPKVSHELTMKYIAEPLAGLSKGLLGEYRPEWGKFYREDNGEFERKLIKPFEDTVPTLEKLRSMNIKTAIVSNRDRPSRAG